LTAEESLVLLPGVHVAGKGRSTGTGWSQENPFWIYGNVTELGVFFPQIRRPVASTQEALIMTLGIRATIARIPAWRVCPGSPH